MHRGYVKIWRKLLDSGIVQDGPMCQIFMKALLNATHKPISRRVGRQMVELQPGEFIFGRNRWAKELGLSPKVVRGRVEKLIRKDVFWAKHRANEFTIFKFRNWGAYQQLEDTEGPTTGPTEGQPGANQGPHKQECKNVNTEEEEGTPGQNLPAPPSPAEYLQEHFPNAHIQELLQKAFELFRLTRQTGKIADSVLIRFMDKLRQFEEWKIGTGLTKYIEGEYYLQNKSEDYALGIIRRCTAEDYYQIIGRVQKQGKGETPAASVQPRTYSQAKDAERRARALRLVGGGHGEQGIDSEGSGQALDSLPISREG